MFVCCMGHGSSIGRQERWNFSWSKSLGGLHDKSEELVVFGTYMDGLELFKCQVWCTLHENWPPRDLGGYDVVLLH